MARWAGGSWNGNVMSAFSTNRRRILSLWLPRLPIDRIKRQLAANSAERAENSEAVSRELSHDTDGRLPPPLRGRAGERGKPQTPSLPPPPSLTLPRKGGGNNSYPSVV